MFSNSMNGLNAKKKTHKTRRKSWPQTLSWRFRRVELIKIDMSLILRHRESFNDKDDFHSQITLGLYV